MNGGAGAVKQLVLREKDEVEDPSTSEDNPAHDLENDEIENDLNQETGLDLMKEGASELIHGTAHFAKDAVPVRKAHNGYIVSFGW